MGVSWTNRKILAGAVILLLVTGGLHRWAHLSRASMASTYRRPAVPLYEVPSELGPYVLQRDLPLTREVLQAARVDSFVYREYVDPTAGRSVRLYVGYWGHENVGMGHGPEVCFPAAGWQDEGAAEHRALRFPGINGITTEAVIGIHHFVRAEPEGIERLAVGFVAVVDGQFRASSRGVFLHRLPRTPDTGYLAHVEVTTPAAHGTWEAADSHVITFMKMLLPHVSRCLLGPQVGSNHDGLRRGEEQTHG